MGSLWRGVEPNHPNPLSRPFAPGAARSARASAVASVLMNSAGHCCGVHGTAGSEPNGPRQRSFPHRFGAVPSAAVGPILASPGCPWQRSLSSLSPRVSHSDAHICAGTDLCGGALAAPADPPTHPHQNNFPREKKKKFIKGAQNWRLIEVQKFVFGL